MKRTRLKQRSRLDRLQRVLDQMTVRNTLTEQAYRARFGSVFVILSDLVPAVVTGYFPSGMLRVVTDHGEERMVQMDQVREDCGIAENNK